MKAQRAPYFSQIAQRYARALYDLAVEKKSLSALRDDVRAMIDGLEAHKDLRQTLQSQGASRREKQAVLEALMARSKATKIFKNFVLVMAANGRADALLETLNAFEARDADAQGIVTAHIRVARPLTPSQEKTLVKSLEQKTGKTIVMETAVEPDLLAGMVVQIGSTLYDASLKSKLDTLHLTLKQPQE